MMGTSATLVPDWANVWVCHVAPELVVVRTFSGPEGAPVPSEPRAKQVLAEMQVTPTPNRPAGRVTGAHDVPSLVVRNIRAPPPFTPPATKHSSLVGHDTDPRLSPVTIAADEWALHIAPPSVVVSTGGGVVSERLPPTIVHVDEELHEIDW